MLSRVCLYLFILSFEYRIFINGSLGSSMTYINGSNDSEETNVVMLESETFGPNLLTFQASKYIQKGDELLLAYGESFWLPSDKGPAASMLKKSASKSRTKRSDMRPHPPPIAEAPPSRRKVRQSTTDKRKPSKNTHAPANKRFKT